MNEHVLLELAKKWEAVSKDPEIVDGHEDAKLGNALSKGVRIGLAQAASELRLLVKLLTPS